MTRQDEIYVGGYQEHSQLTPADSLAGELRDDPLDAGYSPPDRAPRGLRPAFADEWRHETLDERLAEEEPDIGVDYSGHAGAGGRRGTPGTMGTMGTAGIGDTVGIDDSTDGIDADRRPVQQRSGRLLASGSLGYDEGTGDVVDVGKAGWAASAEEAAVHLIDDDDDDDDNGDDFDDVADDDSDGDDDRR